MSNPVSNAVVPVASSCPQLPGEVLPQIFSRLEGSALGVCLKVSRLWRAWASELLIRELAFLPDTPCFGPREWTHYWGDVEKGPGLPANFFDLLAQPCDFFPEKRRSQTNRLVYFSDTVNGQELSWGGLSILVKNPRHGTSFSFFLAYLSLKDSIQDGSYWALALRDIIPGSEKYPKARDDLLQIWLRDTPYEVPRGIEASVCSLASGVLKGELLYPPNTTTATTKSLYLTPSCTRMLHCVYVGSNGCRDGLVIEYLSENYQGSSSEKDGLAPVWRLPPGPLDPDMLGGAKRVFSEGVQILERQDVAAKQPLLREERRLQTVKACNERKEITALEILVLLDLCEQEDFSELFSIEQDFLSKIGISHAKDLEKLGIRPASLLLFETLTDSLKKVEQSDFDQKQTHPRVRFLKIQCEDVVKMMDQANVDVMKINMECDLLSVALPEKPPLSAILSEYNRLREEVVSLTKRLEEALASPVHLQECVRRLRSEEMSETFARLSELEKERQLVLLHAYSHQFGILKTWQNLHQGDPARTLDVLARSMAECYRMGA